MAILFTPPEPPPPDSLTVQEQCQEIVEERITMAPQRVIDAYERARAKGEKADQDRGGSNAFSGSRETAIEENALAIGAQAGMNWRYAQIEEILENPQVESLLERTFRFSRFLTEESVLYPIISEARRSFEASGDGQTARSSRATWRIIEPARIVSVPPTWRTYLQQPREEGVPNPPTALLPYNESERLEWEQGICEGVAQGIQQADLIFQDRMTHLVRDYSGMMRYATLEAQNVVNPPEVIEGQMGTRIAADGEKAYVDDRMIRITGKVRFQGVDEWETEAALPLEGGGRD